VRELREELGVAVHAAARLIRYPHAYPDRTVWLDLWTVSAWSGEPQGLDGQAFKWVAPARLHEEDILEADRPMIEALVGSQMPPARSPAD
jgi:8-oxo-dGTP diphosphatase